MIDCFKLQAQGSVLDLDSATYKPQTQATRSAYNALLDIIQSKLGDYSGDIINGAATEVLNALKNDRLKVSCMLCHTSGVFKSNAILGD